MADNKQDVASSSDIRELIESQNRMAQAIRDGQAPRKKTFGARDFKPVSAANPQGLYDGQKDKLGVIDPETGKVKIAPTGITRKFTRTYYQNGARVNIRTTSLKEIKALEELQAGKYIDNIVTVRVTTYNGEDVDRVDIYYPNKKIEDRIRNATLFPTLLSMCEQCNGGPKVE